VTETLKGNVLRGHYWDSHANEMRIKRRGLNSFCCQLDLLSLRRHELGRDAIERQFFGRVDTLGAIARDILVTKGVNALDGGLRLDFARLVLSLEARRPMFVSKLRNLKGEITTMLDNDPEVIALANQSGITERPSEFYQRQTGVLLEDRALLMIQGMVDNPMVGGRLINAAWRIFRLGRSDETLILSDRPLIRFCAYDDQNAVWILPLNPRAMFVAANSAQNIGILDFYSANRLAKYVNKLSAKQTERFAFSITDSHGEWLEKYLGPRR